MTLLDRLVPAATRASLRQWLSPRNEVRLRCYLKGYPVPRWGNLRRLRPISENFGFERGTPVDRHFLHAFLQQQRADITGQVLEIQAPLYTKRFGQDVTLSETVDIDSAVKPTYLTDLAMADGTIPSNRFDCFLLPNTLCVLEDIEGCLREALRVVRPGGAILATTGAFVPLTPDTPDYWHGSGPAWQLIADKVWPGCDVTVTQHGNVLTAVAALLGLAAEELTSEELQYQDFRYPVLITLRCVKPRPVGAA